MEFEVTWGINLDANSPREAALKALEILRDTDPANLGLLFQVASDDVDGPEVMDVDLSPGRPMRECRHCGRRIEMLHDGTWIDPEAGYDDEDGDGIWRETCDAHDSFIADHEPCPACAQMGHDCGAHAL